MKSTKARGARSRTIVVPPGGSINAMAATPFQIVGCVFSPEPAAERIDAFATQARRERAVVTARSARQATFVKFQATDGRLIALACRAVHGASSAALRFGFACSTSESTMQSKDGVRVSSRAIAQASELAAGARDGEVLLSAQLASLVMGSAVDFASSEIHLPGERKAVACTLAVAPVPDAAGTAAAEPTGGEPAARESTLDDGAAAWRDLAARTSAMRSLQDDLDARQAAMRDQMASGAERLDQMLLQVATLSQALDQSQRTVDALQAQIARVDAQRQSIDAAQSRAEGITHMLSDLQVNLEMFGEQRAVIDDVGEKLARLDFTVQEARNTLRALQRERELAERVEQGIKALRARPVSGKVGAER
jgi:hypothetical protein